MKLGIYGTGGMGREMLTPLRRKQDLLAMVGRQDWDEIVFIDDNVSGDVRGVAIVKLSEMRSDDRFILAIGSSAGRMRLEPMCLDKGMIPYSFEDTTHLRDDDVAVGDGALFCAFTAATAGTRIGRQFQCNLYSHVSHDCVIGDYVTFAPKVCVNGNVHIEDGVWLGAGAIIKNGIPGNPIVIGKGATVGMGAVVTKSVAPGATVMGVPAR